MESIALAIYRYLCNSHPLPLCILLSAPRSIGKHYQILLNWPTGYSLDKDNLLKCNNTQNYAFFALPQISLHYRIRFLRENIYTSVLLLNEMLNICSRWSSKVFMQYMLYFYVWIKNYILLFFHFAMPYIAVYLSRFKIQTSFILEKYRYSYLHLYNGHLAKHVFEWQYSIIWRLSLRH